MAAGDEGGDGVEYGDGDGGEDVGDGERGLSWTRRSWVGWGQLQDKRASTVGQSRLRTETEVEWDWLHGVCGELAELGTGGGGVVGGGQGGGGGGQGGQGQGGQGQGGHVQKHKHVRDEI